MVKKKRHQKSQSNVFGQQSVFIFTCESITRYFYPVILVSLLAACSSGVKKETTNDTRHLPQILDNAKKLSTETRLKSLEILTTEGINSQATFSNSGTQMVFVSAHRLDHTNSQVYFYDFQSKKTTRFTYSDGHLSHPFYAASDSQVFYSSSTDEEKEQPNFERLTGQTTVNPIELELNIIQNKYFPPYEIYLRLTKGDTITRIRRAFGYDLAEDIDSPGKKLLVTSHRNGKTQIAELDILGKAAGKERVLTTFDFLYEPSPRYAHSKGNTNEIVWTAKSDKGLWQILKLQNGSPREGTLIYSSEHQPKNLATSRDGKWIAFTSDIAEVGNLDVYMLELENNCLTRITYAAGDDLFPTFSPDSSHLLLTSQRTGQYQVYLAELSKDAVNCLKP